DTDERADYLGFDRQSSAAHPPRLARCDSKRPDLRVVGETGARRGRANDLAHAGCAIGRTLWLPLTTPCGLPAARRRSCSCTSRTRRALLVYAAAGYRADSSDRISAFRGTRARELRLVTRLAETFATALGACNDTEQHHRQALVIRGEHQ